MKNVMFFTHHLWSGGAEKTVCTLSEYINAHVPGFTSYICVVYDDPKMHRKLHNVIVMTHRSKAQDTKVHKAVNVIRQIREMKGIKKKYHIDTCVSFLPGADIINVLSGTGEKQIVSVRSRESQFTKNIFKKVYVQTAYRKCDLVTTVSDIVRQDVISFFGVNPEKVMTIHNAVIMQPVEGTCSPEFLSFIEGKHVFINVGRLRRVKGQIHLLYAFKDYLRKDPDGGLVIAGGGELYDDLKHTAAMLGIADRVLFTGEVHNPYAYMKRCDAFVLSSDVEGMPNVILEAMQCGLPVIATDCGAEEILNPVPEMDEKRSISKEKGDRQGEKTGSSQKADGSAANGNLSDDFLSAYHPDGIRSEKSFNTKDGIRLLPHGLLVPVCGSNMTPEDFSSIRDISDKERILSDAMSLLLRDDKLREYFREGNPRCTALFSMEHIIKKWLEVL